MKFVTTTIALAAFLSVFGNSNAIAQDGRHNAIAPIPTTQTAWTPQPYVAASSLPPGYTGLDVKKLWSFLKSKQQDLQKGEYETTAQFEQRLSTSSIAPLVSSDEYALLLHLDLPPRYDADAQTFTAYQPVWCRKTQDDSSNPGWVTCTIDTISNVKSNYVGTNAFGVKATIDKIIGSEFGIALPSSASFFNNDIFVHNSLGEDAPGHDLKAIFHVPISVASRLKGKSIGLLLVGRLSSARLIQGTPTSHPPTLNQPYDIFVSVGAVPFTPTELILFVEQTGDVLGTKAL